MTQQAIDIDPKMPLMASTSKLRPCEGGNMTVACCTSGVTWDVNHLDIRALLAPSLARLMVWYMAKMGSS